MTPDPMSRVVKERVSRAAGTLGVVNPVPYVGPLLDRSFPLPAGHEKYAANALMPGYAPAEPRFRAEDADVLRFTIEPLGPESSPLARRHEATREMRRLVGGVFGGRALRDFDERSEDWRGMSAISRLNYGAWFGSAYDRDGLRSAGVVYEMHPWQLNALPPRLASLVQLALEALPTLVPLFSTIDCDREAGSHRVTFLHQGPIAVSDLESLMRPLGLGHQLPGLMQVVGLALGGRFELPERSALVAVGETPEGPEITLEVLLGRLPDVPASFLDLLALGLSERPRELRALIRWLQAFTPDESPDGPGDISVLSVRTTPLTPAQVALHLRPVEFAIPGGHRPAAPVLAAAAGGAP